MENKKNPLLLAASICLILLAVISLVYAVLTNLGLGQSAPSNLRERPAMEEGEGNFSPEDLMEQSDGQQSEEQSGQPSGGRQMDATPPEGFEDNQMTRGDNYQQGNFPEEFNNTGAYGGNQNRWLVIGIYAVALILAVLAGSFILKGKRWSVFLGIFLSIILGGIGLLGFFNSINWLQIVISVVKTLLGIGVITLLFLPGARKVYAKKNDIFDEDDYALYYGTDEAEEDASDETESEST